MPRNRSEKVPAIPAELARYRQAVSDCDEHSRVCPVCTPDWIRSGCDVGSPVRRKFDRAVVNSIPRRIVSGNTWADILDKTLAHIKANYSAPKKVQTDAT